MALFFPGSKRLEQVHQLIEAPKQVVIVRSKKGGKSLTATCGFNLLIRGAQDYSPQFTGTPSCREMPPWVSDDPSPIFEGNPFTKAQGNLLPSPHREKNDSIQDWSGADDSDIPDREESARSLLKILLLPDEAVVSEEEQTVFASPSPPLGPTGTPSFFPPREVRAWGPGEIGGFSVMGVLLVLLLSLMIAFWIRWLVWIFHSSGDHEINSFYFSLFWIQLLPTKVSYCPCRPRGRPGYRAVPQGSSSVAGPQGWTISSALRWARGRVEEMRHRARSSSSFPLRLHLTGRTNSQFGGGFLR